MKRLLPITPFGIRVQLTLWYTVISATLIFLFGIAFYTSLQASFASSLDTTLQMFSHEAAENVSVVDGKVTIRTHIRELPEIDATAALIDTTHGQTSIPGRRIEQDDAGPGTVSHQTGSSVFVRIFDKTGKLLYASPIFNTLHVPPESITQPLQQGIHWRGTIKDSRGQSVRLYSTVMIDHTTVVGVVQVAESLTGF
jgi:two-component system, OmpR family, sensor kinase